MITQSHEESFRNVFRFLREAPDSLAQAILDSSVYKTAPPNTLLKTEGEYCSDFVFLCSGEKRVYKQCEAGREITLYEMAPGDVCVLNASCILSSTPLPANAASLTDVGMILTPSKVFLNLLADYEPFRSFVFSHISTGFASIMMLVSEIAFNGMRERLENYLLEKSDNYVLDTTHQRIADDLGTSREVVSRLLKDLEHRGALKLSRHRIELRNLS